MPSEQTQVTNGAADTSTAPSESGQDTSSEQMDMFAGFDFGGMEFSDQTDSDTPAEKTEPSPVDEGATPVTEPAPSAPVQVTPAAPPVQQSQTPAAVPQQPPVEPPAPVLTEEQFKAQLLEHQRKAVGELQKFYAIDEETAARFETEPMAVLTDIAAKIHLSVLQNAYQSVLNQLPQVAYNTVEQVNQHRSLEDKFYKAWPLFNREDSAHTKTLQTYGMLFRQQHPTASADEFTKFVGAAAAAHLGLKMPPAARKRAVPHSPAASAGGTPPAQTGEQPLTQVEEMMAVWQQGNA